MGTKPTKKHQRRKKDAMTYVGRYTTVQNPFFYAYKSTMHDLYNVAIGWLVTQSVVNKCVLCAVKVNYMQTNKKVQQRALLVS